MTRQTKRFLMSGTVAVGALMVLLCGSCTAYFMVPALWGLIVGDGYGGQLSTLVLVISSVVGGIPILIGTAIVRTGLRDYRASRSIILSENDNENGDD